MGQNQRQQIYKQTIEAAFPFWEEQKVTKTDEQ